MSSNIMLHMHKQSDNITIYVSSKLQDTISKTYNNQ